MMLHIKYQGFKPCGFSKFLSRDPILSLCNKDMQRTGTIRTIIKEGHIRIISAKFGQNPARSLGGDVL